MVQAAAAAQVVQLIGLPEGLYPPAQATIYLAWALKSATIKNAYFAGRGRRRPDQLVSRVPAPSAGTP